MTATINDGRPLVVTHRPLLPSATRRTPENRWGIAIASGLPALLVALAVPLVVDGAIAGFAVAPLVIAVIVSAAAGGALAGSIAVAVSLMLSLLVANVTGFPVIPLAAVTFAVTVTALLSWLLTRGRWPAAAAVPGVILIGLALLSGLANTLEGRLIASLAAVSIALLAFLAGPWALRDAVRTTKAGEATALLMLVVVGVVTYAVSTALEGRLGTPERLSWLGISDPVDAPDGSPPDPFFIAARWQLEPGESERELFTVVTGVQAPVNRPVWASFARYNGFGWFTVADPGRPGDALEQPVGDRWVSGGTRVDIGLALPGLWVPAPQQVTQVLGAVATRVESESDIVTALSTPVDQAFTVSYAIPTATEEQLQEVTPMVIDDIDAAVLLPGALPADLQRIADRVAEQAGPDTWDRLLALSRYLREDRFAAAAPTVLADGTPDRTYAGLVEVIASGEGLQEQYAAAWALIARSWGVPTRIVIGWVPPGADSTASSPQTVTVRGADTSVWAQARLSDLGWVSYQPSPQDRDAGRPAVVRPLLPEDAPAPEPTPAPDPDDGSVPDPDGGDGGGDEREQPKQSSSMVPVLITAISSVLLAAIAMWILLVTRSRRVLRRRLEEQPPAQSAQAAVEWARALLAEAHHPLPSAWAPAPLPLETPELPEPMARTVTELAEYAAPIRFAPGTVSAEEAAQVWRHVDALDAQLVTHGGRRLWVRRHWLRLRVEPHRVPVTTP